MNTIVSKSQKIYLGIASAGANALNGFVLGALLKFYTDVLYLDEIIAGVVFILYGVWNLLFDPFYGYYSDRTIYKQGKGKRLRWIKGILPLFVLGFILIWLGQSSWNDIVLFFFMLGSYFVFDTSFTIFIINHSALSTSITDDPNERASIGMYDRYLSIIATVFGFIPIYLLTGAFTREQIIPIFYIIGGIALLFVITGSYKIKEPTIETEQAEPLHLKAALRETFKSRAFIFFIFYSFLVGGVALSFGTIISYYLQWVVGLEGFDAIIPAIIASILLFVCYPVVLKLNEKSGIRKILMINTVIGMIGLLLLLILNSSWYFVLIIAYFLVQLAINIHWMLLTTMVGDITDEDELKTGLRREGMFYGITAVIYSPAQSVIIGLFTLILTIFNYDNDIGAISQTPEAILGIRLGIGLIPLIFLVIGFIMLYFYPLHGVKYQELKKELKGRNTRN
jgi:GPH family glycoside/pentoside/hexuronide:cation symporter